MSRRLHNPLVLKLKTALLLVLIGFSQAAIAGHYSNQHFMLDIPDSFQWYVSTDSAGNTTYAFRDSKRPIYKTAEISITLASYGNALNDFPAQSKKVIRNLYIEQAVQDMKNGRLTFKAEPIQEFMLANQFAAQVNWQAEDYGVPNQGSLYLFVHQSQIYLIKIQDYVERAKQTMPILQQIVASFRLAADAPQPVNMGPASPTLEQ